jgi:hypothetical protein
VGITGGGQNAVVTEYFLNFEQINTGFDQMGGVALQIRRDIYV